MVSTGKYKVKGDPDQMKVFADFYFAGGESVTDSRMLKGKFRIQVSRDIQRAGRLSTLILRRQWKAAPEQQILR